MKLGMMLEVDETFTSIWLKVRVKVRGWPQSPIGTIFNNSPTHQVSSSYV